MPQISNPTSEHDQLAGVTSAQHHTVTSPATREFWVPFLQEGSSVYPYPTSSGPYPLCDVDIAESVKCVFHLPDDFTTLEEAAAIVVPATTKTYQYDLFSEYASVGEAKDANTESIADATDNMILNQLFEVDVSGVFSSLAAGDWVGLQITSDTTNLRLFYLRIKYS